MNDILDGLDINPEDLLIDTYHNASSPFWANSYIRIAHKPTGIVIDWNDGKSPQQVRRKALELLSEKLKMHLNTNS